MAVSRGPMPRSIPQSASRYVPALDGLRAISILIVLAAHTELVPFVPGGFGVTLFFFVSGYLLTGQMIAEYDRRNAISFRGFYSRRALRLLPAALAYILIAGLFFLAIGGRNTVLGWLAAMFYGANYYDIFLHYRDTIGPMHEFVRNPFDILWSLAVEEHFYFLWPALLTATMAITRPRRTGAVVAVLLVCILVPLWRQHLYDGWCTSLTAEGCSRLYEATDTRLDSIAWGALCALIINQRWYLAVIRSRAAHAIAILVLLAAFYKGEPYREVYRFTVDGIALSVVIPALAEGHMRYLYITDLLETRVAVFIGRISYSLYLWHWGSFGAAEYLVGTTAGPGVTDRMQSLETAAIALPLGFALACASWYGIERPMVKLRRRFGSHAPTGIAGPTAPVAVPSDVRLSTGSGN